MTLQFIQDNFLIYSEEYLWVIWALSLVSLLIIIATYIRKSGSENIAVIVEKKKKTRKLIEMLEAELIRLKTFLTMLEHDIELNSIFNIQHATQSKKVLRRLIILNEYIGLFENNELQKEILDFVEYTDALMSDIQQTEEKAYIEKREHMAHMANAARKFEKYRDSTDYRDTLARQELRDYMDMETNKTNDIEKAQQTTRIKLLERVQQSNIILARLTNDMEKYKELNVEHKKFYPKELAYV
ncbi:MAG: hypothetical protein ACOZAO_01880 [Patescibacteria group bacterium]